MARSPRAPSRPASPPEVMTISDLAQYLQVSKSSLYKLVQSGRVHGQKVGKHWRFSRAAIDNWLGNGATKVPTDRRTQERSLGRRNGR